MPSIYKHLIPFTGADRYNYNFVISGRPKGGTYQFRPDCAVFLDSTTSVMAVSAGQNGIDCLEGSDRLPAQPCGHGAGCSMCKALKKQVIMLNIFSV